MNDLLLNEKTRRQIEVFLASPCHALLLTGQTGVGLGTIAKYLAKTLAGPDAAVISPTVHKGQTSKVINISDVREISNLTRSRRTKKLAIVIDECEKMAQTAPEAFLKQLEEPNQNVHFILTSHRHTNLPTTILSRVQQIKVLPVHEAEYRPMINNIAQADKRRQVSFMASGLPAEIVRLTNDDEYFSQASWFYGLAKQFLSGNTYRRLRLISSVKNRDEAIKFATTLGELCLTLSRSQTKYVQNLEIINQTIDNLSANGNLRVQLTNLAVNMV